MASLLKNQILKHLSKFCKNLSTDKISLSTLKGEGELCNLELDEDIITELLDLPTWLKISRASCNRVSIKIQWTKLKSQPIYLMLDKVQLEAETCETPRPPNNPAHMASYRSGGKYGFVDRVIDGIFVHVESVEVKLMSRAFHASLQLLRLRVQSTTPNWQPSSDLRQTRIRDAEGGEILLFKEIEWQNMKVEANAKEAETPQDVASTPLRLLANQAKIRITMKKKLSDCSIISTRVMLLLDDILWVLTATQLKAAILYSNSLKEVIERSAQQSKKLAAEKLQKQGHSRTQSEQFRQQQQQQQPTLQTRGSAFAKYDVASTSYHLITSRIDLHLCDDRPVDTGSDSEKTWKTEGGSMQVTMYKLSVDVYPFHPAVNPNDDECGERKHWHRYMDNIGSRNPWVQQLFSSFRDEVMQARKAFNIQSPTHSQKPSPQHPFPSPQHVSSSPHPPPLLPSQTHAQPYSPWVKVTPGCGVKVTSSVPQPSSKEEYPSLESCVVVKLEDFTIYMVSTPDNKRTGHPKFFASDKKLLHLPADMSVLHLEYTDYFFPEGLESPVPHANLYVLLNPVRLTVDFLTLLWTNYFMLSLSQNLELDNKTSARKEHVDIKVEAVMPRVIIPNEFRGEGQSERPEYLQLQMSKICATNTRVELKAERSDLAKILDVYEKEQLLRSEGFPRDDSTTAIPPHFRAHADSRDNQYFDKGVKQKLSEFTSHEFLAGSVPGHELSTNTLKRDAGCDMWCVLIDQVWLEFLLSLSSKSRPQPFVEAFPLALWICQPHSLEKSNCAKDSFKDFKSSNPGHKGVNEVKSDEGDRDKRPQRLLLKQYYSCDSDDEGHAKGDEGETAKDGSICDNDKEKPAVNANNLKEDVQYSDCHVVASVGGKLRIQLNHLQYVLLMRLNESFSKFQTQINSDLSSLGSKDSMSMCVPLVLPQIEFAAVCPCLINQRCFPDDFSSPVSPLDKLSHLTMPASKEFANADYPRIEFTESDMNLPSDVPSSPNMMITKSMSDSTIQSHSNGMLSHSESTSDFERKSSSGNPNPHLCSGQPSPPSLSPAPPTTTRTPLSPLAPTAWILASAWTAAAALEWYTKAQPQMKKALSSVSSAFSSFTDKLKLKTDDDMLSVSDDLETMSIKTDMSSDDEFEHLTFEDSEVPAFCHDPPSDTASTTDTYSDMADDTSSVYAESSSTRGKEIISIVLFKLDTTEVLMTSSDKGMTVAAQVSKLLTCQPGNISAEDFHAKFSSQKGFFQDNTLSPSHPKTFPYTVQYRADTTTTPNSALLTVRSHDSSLSFKMSSLMSLSEFVEEEKLSEPIPMVVDVHNLLLILEEDRPSSNPVSPGAMPIDLQIHKLTIRRGSDGVFHLSGGSIESAPLGMQSLQPIAALKGGNSPSHTSDTSPGKESEEMSTPVLHLEQFRQVQMDNMELRRQIQEYQAQQKTTEKHLTQLRAGMEFMEKLTSENETLKQKLSEYDLSKEDESTNRYEMENLQLQQKVAQLEEEIVNMTTERDSLFATLKLLQDDLMASEKRHRSHTTAS
ncbi:LOW QUALITY PROTEIN: UHRF1-binding protein 1-like [Haliotis rubra]|uniref:LOW QUALITY PROTEIN: UHRF1-binding protein 1-like n=1 Tax=Haliotis rubra TaxID=36100 RepID=UPI001EE51C03|nr:LOW QUALITY PROTEIN: UHRF1-binding protein 1-like [Haliotis rubra]